MILLLGSQEMANDTFYSAQSVDDSFIRSLVTLHKIWLHMPGHVVN